MDDNVKRVNFGGMPFRELEEMRADVMAAIMAYEGRVPTMAVIGVLRLVEKELLDD